MVNCPLPDTTDLSQAIFMYLFVKFSPMKPIKTFALLCLFVQVFSNGCTGRKSSPDPLYSFSSVDENTHHPLFSVILVFPEPVIKQGDAGTEGNIYGFEGGRVLKIRNAYHLFTTEMCCEPVWGKTRLAHWKSTDGHSWKRESTVFESSGDFTGTDNRAALWSPMPTYDKKNRSWILTYVCYRSKPNTSEAWYRNYDGIIALARSTVKGRKGIGGPYIEETILLRPDTADPKPGLMGIDSFFPYKTKNGWLAFYGSSPEWNGLAKSPSLTGPWERMYETGIVSRHTENPVVSQFPDGKFVAFFDGCGYHQKFGYMVSADGIQWSEAVIIDLDDHPGKWWRLSRTPLGLVDEGRGEYTLYFTAYNKNFYEIPGIWEAKSDSVFDGFFAGIGRIRLKKNH